MWSTSTDRSRALRRSHPLPRRALLFANRTGYAVQLGRLVTMAMLLGWLPAAAVLPPLVAIAVLPGVLAALIAGETVRYADVRRALGRG